ncbi:hypothetical protein [Streptomyces harbinensis]|uniref:Uncharacterized protein n=1 Tax=Streptomyces harbinensis TaxID=1176198 RepID=A0A1I6V6H7_9ACTN|nr:hypothetical protein [Streptomyces harbinensis]SFT09236.1 hypothetical protein SAMN05444716_107116 [Streptomyces harbinensis]
MEPSDVQETDWTAPALERVRVRSWRWVYLGLAVAGVSCQLLLLESEWPAYPVPVPVGWGVLLGAVGVAGGVWRLSEYGRMRRTLARHPWTACSAVIRQGVLVLRAEDTEPRWQVRVPRTPWRPRPVPDGDAVPLWWAGPPGAGGVVARADGTGLSWAGPVAAESGPTGEATGGNAEPVYPDRAAVRPVRSRLLLPWGAVLGLLLLVLGQLGHWARYERDELVQATVTAAEYGTVVAGDWCAIAWEDPFGGGERHAERVSCPPDNAFGRWSVDSPLYIWIVADGPWRGEYYHHPQERLAGPGGMAEIVYTGLSDGGLLLLAGCLPALAIRREGRQRLRDAAATYGPGSVPVASAVPPSVAGPVRAASHPAEWMLPWWRIPALWWRSGIPAALIAMAAWQPLILLVFVLQVALSSLPAGPRVAVFLLPLAIFPVLIVLGIRALIKLERVRALARTARTPYALPYRYELRHPEGGEPVLALFPPDTEPGPDARPVDVLPLEPPTGRCPWPHRPEPVGTAWVHGYGPRVPRIDGEVFWPRG